MMLMLSPTALPAQEQETSTNQELLDRIETLEKQLKRMEDENKARKSLEVTEEEKSQQEREVLQAVSREYTLGQRGTLSIDYSLGYSYSPSETLYTTDEVLQLKRNANHTLTHSVYTSYSALDNLTTSLTLPIVYRYNKMGTDDELDETDIGDISLGVAFQLPKKFQLPAGIRNTYSIGCSLPTGRSPYKINPDTELSTGSGYYSVSIGSSFSKQVDPVVLFWSVGYTYPFDLRDLEYMVQDTVTLDKVDLGSSFSCSMGMGYALSYANSINISFSYSYQKSSTFTYEELTSPVKTGDSTSASMGLGMGFVITPKTSVSVSVSYSLISSGFSLTTRVPFDFVL